MVCLIMMFTSWHSGLADSVPNSEVYQCHLQPTDFVRGNIDLRVNGWYIVGQEMFIPFLDFLIMSFKFSFKNFGIWESLSLHKWNFK